VIDKPFALTSGEGEELIALAASRGLVLSAFHNRRWDADFLTVRKLLDSGVLGEVMLYEARWDRFRPAISARLARGDGGASGDARRSGAASDRSDALQLFGTPEAITADIAAQRPRRAWATIISS
jgi:scyllo-inositol 2-dehydrogenase (NADP+)